MSKHTPGPWAIGELSEGINRHVCVARKSKIEAGDRVAVCLISGVSTFNEEDAANARLISASPDLLAAADEALTLIVSMASYQHEPDRIEEVCTKLEQAISKAIYKWEGAV